MKTIHLRVINPVGLHARPAAEFVKSATQFKSKITVCNVTRHSASVDAKSILSILTLGVEKDHEIEVKAEGEDEVLAIQTLQELVESDFAGRV